MKILNFVSLVCIRRNFKDLKKNKEIDRMYQLRLQKNFRKYNFIFHYSTPSFMKVIACVLNYLVKLQKLHEIISTYYDRILNQSVNNFKSKLWAELRL